MVRSSLAPSASAPQLLSATSGVERRSVDRSRLERMLAKAELGGAVALSASIDAEVLRKNRAPGGAPFRQAPSVRTTPAQRLASTTVSFPKESKIDEDMRLSVSRSFPAPSPPTAAALSRASGNGLSRAQTPSTRQAGQYVKSLLGDDDGQGGLHWRLVEEMDALDGLMNDHVVKKQMAEKKLRQKEDLTAQVQQIKQREADHRQSSMDWRQRLEADANQFEAEQKRKKEQSHRANLKFQEEQTRLIEDLKRRREDERLQKDRDAAELISQDQAALNKQLAADEKRKKFQQKMALEMADAAHSSMKMKVEQKRKEAEQDVLLLKMQEQMLAERDRERQRNKDNTVAKQTRMQEVYQAGAGNESSRLQQIEEEKARLAMVERMKKEEEAHLEKVRKLKQLELAGRAFVSQQLEDQKAQRAREREDNLHRREVSDRDAEAAMAEQRRKDQMRRDREKENQEFLRMQILQKNGGGLASDQMTDIEKSLNKDRLERARDSERLRLLFENKQQQYRATRGHA